jgi:lipopolysaccharide transport system ATP-binding protein
MSFEPAIEVRNLGKCYNIYDRPEDRLKQILSGGRRQFYREFWALRDVDFSIGKGETVGIIGRNGSGKSTLLQMICGTLTPTSGSVKAHGRVAALLELGAGFNPEFTGRENIRLNAAILGLSPAEITARMPDIIAFSELADFIDQPVKTFSSGMYARLAFSVAINVDPDILIVDEALAVGDARFVAKCMRRIKDIQSSGSTILFVSHDIGSLRALCSRAIWLEAGKLRDDGDVFPVTGRFVEDMFKDEAGEETAGLQGNETAAVAQPETSADLKPQQCELPKPIIHWGSHKGFIKSAFISSGKGGLNTDVLLHGDDIDIRIELDIPDAIPRDSLVVAVSIKDLKGTDLIVSTTQDLHPVRLPAQERFSVNFRLKNMLTTGQFLLVAAVERRLSMDIHYYEYVEGIRYFSSLSDKKIFGLFHPEVLKEVVLHNDSGLINYKF